RKRAGDRFLFMQTRADYEGKSEALAILPVVFAELFHLFGRGMIEPSARLFRARRLGDLIIADQIRVGPNERKFLVVARLRDRVTERGGQIFARSERTLRTSARGHPRGMFENLPEKAREFFAPERIQLCELWHRVIGVNELTVRRNGETERASLWQGKSAGDENPARNRVAYAQGCRGRGAAPGRFRVVLHLGR